MSLVIDGGAPVRTERLPGAYPGASVYGAEELEAVRQVLACKSPFRFYGDNVVGMATQFEAALCQRMDRRFSLATSSGTAALIVALVACGIGPGDQVIIPANTFYATAGAVICAGAVPIYCDIDDSMNLDPQKLEALIGPAVRAVVTVPILGNACDMDPIVEICRRRGVLLIEDNAQSWGARYKGVLCGTFGEAATYSLQLNKMITAGEGGALITNSPQVIERACRFHDQGQFRAKAKSAHTKDLPDIPIIGQNYRMSEVTAAIAVQQLNKLDSIIERLQAIKQQIKSEIMPLLTKKGVTFRRILDPAGDSSNTIMLYLPTAPLAKRFKNALAAENIFCSHLYEGEPVYQKPSLFHQNTAHKSGFPFNQFSGNEKVSYHLGLCPVAEDILSRNVMIPLAPVFTEKDCGDIIEGVKKVAEAVL